MSNQELAQLIQDRFTPFAFKCDCNGDHPDCLDAINNAGVWSQYDTVMRIVKFIGSLEK